MINFFLLVLAPVYSICFFSACWQCWRSAQCSCWTKVPFAIFEWLKPLYLLSPSEQFLSPSELSDIFDFEYKPCDLYYIGMAFTILPITLHSHDIIYILQKIFLPLSIRKKSSPNWLKKAHHCSSICLASSLHLSYLPNCYDLIQLNDSLCILYLLLPASLSLSFFL